MSVLSLMNDNKGFFIVFIVFNVVFYVIKMLNSTSKKFFIDRIVFILKRSFIFIVLGVFLLVIAYNFTSFGEVIDSYVRIIEVAMRSKINSGSSERFHMIFGTLRNANMRWFGAGIGMYGWTQSGALGYSHFGQSDFGSSICLGGIVFVCFIFYNVHVVFKKIFSDKLIRILCMLVFLFLMLFNAAITSTSMITLYIWFIIVCWMTISDNVNVNDK